MLQEENKVSEHPQTHLTASSGSFSHDLVTVARRAIKGALREPETLIPGILIPLFFFMVNVGALGDASKASGVVDYKAFQLPVSIVFAVTGISRAASLVTDIKSGYFDRLMMTPISRIALLLGLMVADFFVVVALCIPVMILGMILGVSFVTGPLGMLAFVLIGAFWGLAFTGFPYAIALKTGNPGAVNSSFLLFFPFSFLTTAFLPKAALTGWLGKVADWNPVTYLLDGMRSITSVGWEAKPIFYAVLAILGLGLFSQILAFRALRGRTKRV
jgi:ABC-2 type transport system permease protein